VSVRPIFIFSSPRAGSTLVQRVISAHAGVASASEPWLLLPHLNALRADARRADYPQRLAASALGDFCRTLPGGVADYRQELREFILRLYERSAGPDARFFLDKTPPYYLIVEEIVELFPEAAFVFLWRNPLSIMASIIESWQGGHWHPSRYSDALFVGLPRLTSTYTAHADVSFGVRYEDLVGEESGPWMQLMDYLGIVFEPQALEGFRDVALDGRMGDTSGARYAGISAEPTAKWQRTLANPLRKAWSRRYLRWLGGERLAVMGYDLAELLAQLDAAPGTARGLGHDAARLGEALALEPARALAHRVGVSKPGVLLTLLRT
jgi:Sulfotransferase family